MAQFDPIIYAVDDKLIIPEIGDWGIKKYSLVGAYCNIFTSSMKNKWDKLIYIDLFAGAGYANIKSLGRIVHTSSLIAMSTPTPFNHYILSEKEPEKISALRERVERHHPGKSVSYFEGDTNANIEKICNEIESFVSRYRTLCFCFVDPYSLNLHFNTIRALSRFQIDFLILLATNMNFNRNIATYIEPEKLVVDKFLGDDHWRQEIIKSPDKQNIMSFLASQYDKKMVSLGYKKPADKQQIRTGKNLPLYHLAFYSRHALGNEFFDKISHHGDNKQLKLF